MSNGYYDSENNYVEYESGDTPYRGTVDPTDDQYNWGMESNRDFSFDGSDPSVYRGLEGTLGDQEGDFPMPKPGTEPTGNWWENKSIIDKAKDLYKRLTKKDLAEMGLSAALAGLTLNDIRKMNKRRQAAQVPSGKWTAPPPGTTVAMRSQIPQASAPFTGQATIGRQNFTPITYGTRTAAQGGIMGLAAGGLRDGAFVIPADVVSHFGNGSSEAGLAFLAKKLGATPIKGAGDGMSDSIDTTIEGRQPAKVANEEALVSPEKVAALGKGDPKKGAKVLYAMMDRVRHARTGTKKQGKQIKPEKFAPGGIAGYTGGGAVAFVAGGATTPYTGSATTGTTFTQPITTMPYIPPVTTPTTGRLTGIPTTTTTEPINTGMAAWATPLVQDYVTKGFDIANEPYQAYTGTLAAGYSDLQKDAFEDYKKLAEPSALTDAASIARSTADKLGKLTYDKTAFTNQYASPADFAAGQFESGYAAGPAYGVTKFDTGLGNVKSVQDYMNPYLQGVVNIEAQEARRQAAITGAEQQAKLAQAGAFGGSRDAIMRAELARNLNTQIGGIQSKGLQSAYDRALAQRLAESEASLAAQRASEESKQFGYTSGMTDRERAAKYAMDELAAAEQSRQYGYTEKAKAASEKARYAQLAAEASEGSKQFGAKYGLDALTAKAQAAGTLGNIGAQQGRYGLEALESTLKAGQTQRDIEQAGYDALQAQFNEERKYPFKMQQYKQSLLTGLPIETGPGAVAPSLTTQMIQGLAGLAKTDPQLKAYFESMYGKIFDTPATGADAGGGG